MGRSDIEIPDAPYVYGGQVEPLCRECQLPCQLERTSVDCLRRFFLQGMLQCTYFIYGYCFLEQEEGCTFDNGGKHDQYWMQLLNDYFHNVRDREENDPDFVRNAEELRKLVEAKINDRQVPLCRYLEEVYNRVMEEGGGLSEEMMDRLDDAYLALLAGTERKR